MMLIVCHICSNCLLQVLNLVISLFITDTEVWVESSNKLEHEFPEFIESLNNSEEMHCILMKMMKLWYGRPLVLLQPLRVSIHYLLKLLDFEFCFCAISFWWTFLSLITSKIYCKSTFEFCSDNQFVPIENILGIALFCTFTNNDETVLVVTLLISEYHK